MPFPPWRKQTLEEAQSTNETLDIELSIEQKKAAIRKLKEAGLNTRSFGSWREILHWVKTH